VFKVPEASSSHFVLPEASGTLKTIHSKLKKVSERPLAIQNGCQRPLERNGVMNQLL